MTRSIPQSRTCYAVVQTWGLSLAKKSSQLMVPLTAREAKKSVMMLGLQGMMHVSAARQIVCQRTSTSMAGVQAPLPLDCSHRSAQQCHHKQHRPSFRVPVCV